MSLERIENLEARWRELGVFEDVEFAFDRIGFTEVYLNQLDPQSSHAKPKVIKDGVWGMVEVDPSSTRLLDGPLLQRMRWIKQLGLTYLTYPSAEHTRFIHSLGMFCVVSRFMDVVMRRPRESSSPTDPFTAWLPQEEHVRILKHAAILHDVGHMPLSHATERVMHDDGMLFKCGRVSVDDFIAEAEDTLGMSPKLAECLSLAIVLAPRFARFYRSWVHPNADASDTRKIAALIAGIEPEPGLTGLANIISGAAIDADKIDYINRDAEACGIPVGVDVARLFLRSSFLDVRPTEIQRLRSTRQTPSRSEVVFVVNASGLDSIEEIGQARTSLYHRVYLHQTTRNAERLLAKAMHEAANGPSVRERLIDRLFAKVMPAKPAEVKRLIDALEIWAMDDAGLLNYFAANPTKEVASIGSRLKSRRLPKRACAFGRNLCQLSLPIEQIFPRMLPEERNKLLKQVVGNGLEELRTKQLKGVAQRAIELEIAQEAIRLKEILRSNHFETPTAGLELISFLPMPNIEASRSECIILENTQLSSTASSSVSDEQMEATDIVKSAGYVMSDEAWREITFVAARSVLYLRKQLLADIAFKPYDGANIIVKAEGRINLDVEAVVRRVGLDKDKVDRTIRAATRAGYFTDHPRLAPVIVADTTLDRVAERLTSFNGQGNWKVTPRSVRAFLAQFPDHLRSEMAELLLRMRLLDRSNLSVLILEAMATIALNGSRGFITGFSPDSGNLVRMEIEQELCAALKDKGWVFKKTIRDVFSDASADDRLVLLDDNVTSGSQAVCQFLAWMGVDEKDWTSEQRAERGIERTRLSDRDVDALRAMRLSFVTALGTEAARTRLAAELPKLGLDKFDGVVFSEDMRSGNTLPPDLERHLQEVGMSVLAWTRHGESDLSKLDRDQLNDCERDALGYRDTRALVSTLLNVPVGTLTALWCPGFHRGEPWIPLLIRRGYLDKLIIA